MGTIVDELAGLPDRLTDACERVRGLQDQLRAERDRRDELVTTAVDDAGMTQAEVARITGLSRPQVIRILGQHSESDDD